MFSGGQEGRGNEGPVVRGPNEGQEGRGRGSSGGQEGRGRRGPGSKRGYRAVQRGSGGPGSEGRGGVGGSGGVSRSEGWGRRGPELFSGDHGVAGVRWAGVAEGRSRAVQQGSGGPGSEGRGPNEGPGLFSVGQEGRGRRAGVRVQTRVQGCSAEIRGPNEGRRAGVWGPNEGPGLQGCSVGGGGAGRPESPALLTPAEQPWTSKYSHLEVTHCFIPITIKTFPFQRDRSLYKNHIR